MVSTREDCTTEVTEGTEHTRGPTQQARATHYCVLSTVYCLPTTGSRLSYGQILFRIIARRIPALAICSLMVGATASTYSCETFS